ncbi:MAG: hypothetical protein PHY23_03730 [Oscillospiraceae bacterium]|jgi:hypothetical protein|nr:hypothetical protein [Oscillospiraceae bacterium]
MTIGEYYNSKIPEYYPTMYQDGYTVPQILFAARRSIYNRYLESQQVNEIKVTSEVKVK